MKKMVLTGGGSAGHVTPHLALLPKLNNLGWDLHYIGTHQGIERELIGDQMPYYPISAGKLRRYFDLKNFIDPFRVLKGWAQAYGILRRLRPQVVFSKGGFVSVPVAMAAKLLKIPVILHESDMTPGLANKLALPFATHICVTFPETLKHLPAEKASLTGNPIRDELFSGHRQEGLKICGFRGQKPVLLVMGGSLGAVEINEALRESLPKLLPTYHVIHLCGKGNVDATLTSQVGYRQFDYVGAELPHLMAAADFVVSRAGANSLFELLALKKPNLLIPLSRAASRGDQILNARSFAQQGFSLVLEEEELSNDTLVQNLEKLRVKASELVKAMESSRLKDSSGEIIKIIQEHAK